MSLVIRNISTHFGNVEVLSGVSLSVEKGTICALVGPNGAGKTSLFNIINGLIAPDSGQVILNGEDITKMNITQRVDRGIGRLWQDMRLFEKMTVLDNLCLARKHQKGESIFSLFFAGRHVKQEEQQNRVRAKEIAAFLDLDHESDSLAENLSYGQQKLVSIGRLLMNNASLLLLDEPFSGLSPVMIEMVIQKLKQIAAEGKAIFMIEHNLPKTQQIADRIHLLDTGRVVMSGDPQEFSSRKSFLREVYVGL